MVGIKNMVMQDMLPFSLVESITFLRYLPTKLQGITSQNTTILNLIPS